MQAFEDMRQISDVILNKSENETRVPEYPNKWVGQSKNTKG